MDGLRRKRGPLHFTGRLQAGATAAVRDLSDHGRQTEPARTIRSPGQDTGISEPAPFGFPLTPSRYRECEDRARTCAMSFRMLATSSSIEEKRSSGRMKARSRTSIAHP